MKTKKRNLFVGRETSQVMVAQQVNMMLKIHALNNLISALRLYYKMKTDVRCFTISYAK